MIGQDRMVTGQQSTALAPQPPIPPENIKTWIQSVNLSLITAPPNIFALARQQDWPLPLQHYLPRAQTWINTAITAIPTQPFVQTDWPLPTQPYRIDQTWAASYNKNLIGQDKLPAGEQATELPPRDFARLFQTWVNSVNLALVVTPPVLTQTLFKQITDLTPRGPEPDWRRSWEFSYNKNLIGQDQLPFRQSDWPLPQAPAQAAQTWIDQTKILLTAVQRPFVQSDWQLPQIAPQAVQTWTNTIALALTAKPFNQQDWPNPTPLARDPTLSTITASYNKNLIGQDRLPNRQQDWPLPSAHAQAQIPLQIMVQGKPFFLAPVVPLPPGANFFDRPTLRPDVPANLYFIGYSPLTEPFTPPPVTGIIPLRTLMGTGL
jgi:hypothetical protein